MALIENAPQTRAERRAAERANRPNRKRKAVVAGVAAAVLAPAGFLGAVLTDHAQVGGHTVSKSEFSVVAAGQQLIQIDNAAPGSTADAAIVIRNDGSLPADVAVSFGDLVGADLLDAGALTATLTSGSDTLATDTATSWTDGGLELDHLGVGAEVQLNLHLAYSASITNATWDTLANSGAFTVEVDSQQSTSGTIAATATL